MSRRTIFVLSILCPIVSSTSSFAQSSVFPWEGEITGNNVNVRSGQGTRYYATCKLAMGDRVLVLGEVSGWYKILPPADSFSYIDKAAVERHTNDIGSVARDKAYVRAGSHISRRKSRTQVILGKGDPVVILGEADGFYKIEPPKRAVLFVSREFVKPVEASNETGLVKRYSAADWSKAGDAEADDDVVQTPDLPETAESTPPQRNTPIASDNARSEPINRTPTPAQPSTRVMTIEPTHETSPPQPVARPVNDPATPTRTTIRANRPIDERPASRSANNSTLVLSPSSASSDSTYRQPATNEPVRNDDSSTDTTTYDDTYRIDYTDVDRSELRPADRRPPASLPDWAQDGSTDRSNSSRIAASGGATSTDAPRTTPRRSTYDNPSARVATRPQPTAPSTMGTMVEITPGTARRTTNTQWNEPTYTANAPRQDQPTTSGGTPIANYNRPGTDTLTLGPSDSGQARPPIASNEPSIRSNTPIAPNQRSMPRTIVDTRNSFPAAPNTVPQPNTYATTTTNDTYYIDNTTTASSQDSGSYETYNDTYTQPATNNDVTYQRPSSPPPEVPIDPNSGPYAAKLVTLEGELYAIMDLPVQQRPYEQLISRYEEIAVQGSERVPSEYAAIRIDQLKGLERVRRLAVRYASDHQGLQHFSRRMDEEREEIRQTQRQTTSVHGGAFEYEGQLMKSHAFAPEKRRYRLVDMGTQSTVIYVDIPVSVVANPDALTGKRVGIRIGRRQYSEAAQIPIVEAAEVVDLTTPPTKYQPVPAPAARNSDEFSNRGNSRGDNPNPLMNEPMAREQSASGTMGEMEPIES